MALERGVMLIVPHVGNWELLSAYLGQNYPLAALYDPPKGRGLESIVVDMRERFGGQMFPLDVGGLRSVLKHFKSGGLVALLPDQVPARNAGVYVKFFGQVALTMNLAHDLITRARPELLTGVVFRHPGGGYKIEIEKLTIAEDSTREETAQCINDAIERIVRKAPEQYQWEYKRFKRPPTLGKTSIYRRQ